MQNKISEDKTLNNLLTKPVGPLILKNAVPTIISMMVSAIYNTGDTFFVSKLGTSASGAVGIIFSLMALLQAVGFTIGMGSGSITSRALGAKNLEKASTICSTAIFLAFFSGIFISVLGFSFRVPLVRHLGATPTILPYAIDYAKYILFGSPFIITSFTMNNLLRLQGKATFAMVGMISGGILNLFLDPLFIFAFDMGISGAAIATLISQIVSFSILLSMFIRKKSTAELSLKHIAKNIKIYIDIVTTGLPSLFRQGMAALSGIFLNRAAAKFGAMMIAENISASLAADSAVAGMAITNRVFMFLMSVAIGLGQGFQPVCGINYGAGNTSRVKEAYSFLVRLSTTIMTFSGILVFIFAPQIVSFFREDPAVVAIGSLAIRFQACALPFHSLIFGTNMLLQTIGVKKNAMLLSSMRQGIFFIPCIFILPYVVQYFGAQPILGVQLTQTVSDLLAAVCAIPFAINFFKKLDREKNSL